MQATLELIDAEMKQIEADISQMAKTTDLSGWCWNSMPQ